jgi:CHASE2 domain-containing sensor protein/nitrogen-specific signal transduction histidine kinase
MTKHAWRGGKTGELLRISVVLFLLATLAWLVPIADTLQLRIQDGYFRIRPIDGQASKAVVVLIDDQSLQQYGRWPWPREQLAQLIRDVSAAHPRVIGLDVLLPEAQSAKADDALAASFRLAGNVLLVDKIGGYQDGPHWIEPLPEFAAASAGVGHAMAALDKDGVCRRYPVRELSAGGERWAFAVELARLYDSSAADRFLTAYGLRRADENAPVTIAKPLLIPIYYRRGGFETISAAEVLQHKSLEVLGGRAVLIGFGPAEISDRLNTPLTGALPAPGVEIHAQILDGILQGRQLHQLSAGWTLLLLIPTCPMLVVAFRRWRGWALSVALAALLTAVWAAGYLLFFTWSGILPVVPLLLAVVIAPLVTNSIDFIVVERRLAAQLREMRRWLAQRDGGEAAQNAGLLWKLSTLEDLQTQLGALHELHSSLLKATTDAVAVFDDGGRVILQNERFSALFPPSDAQELTFSAIHAQLFPGGDTQVEGQEAYAGGTLYSVRIATLPKISLSREGGTVLTLSSLQTRVERDRARNESLRFVTHELRTPLVAIQGFAELMIVFPSAPECATAPETIFRESKRLVALINTYLDVLRLDSGSQLIRQETVSLDELVCEVLELLQPLANAANVRIHFIAEEPLHVRGDQALLTGAILNLVSNAIKYGSSGTGIEIACRQDEGLVTVSVYNDGDAIPEKELQKLFDTDYRASSVRQDRPGWGLGLAFVKRIAEKHGGSVRAENARSGIRFEVILPGDPQPTVLKG